MNAARRKELSRPTWIHPHPAAILLYSFRQVLLLSIPIVRAVVSLPFGGMDSWDDYLWVDLLAVCGMFALGFLRYLTTGIRIERQGIAYRSGLLVHRQGYIPFAQISVLVCEQKFWFRPIGYCTVYLDTDAGRAQSADFSLNLSKRRAEKLIGQVQSVCRNPDAVKRVCRASWWEVLFLSFISSDSLSGILFLSAAISGLGDFVSTDFQAIIRANFEQFIRLANLLAIRIPPIAAWIAYILMITWGISFLVHVMRNLHFTVSRQDEELYVSSGVLSVYRHYIQTSKINRIEIRQTLLTKLIGVQSVFVQSCGYGKIKNSLSVLLPAGTAHRAAERLWILLPEYRFAANQITPKRRYLGRILGRPFWMATGCIVGFWWLITALPDWQDTLLFLGAAALLPILWFFVVRLVSYRHTGIAKTEENLVFRYSYGYRFLTTAVRKEKITRIQISQNPFQRRYGGCDVLIYTRSERKNHIRVPNLCRAEVEALFGFENDDIRRNS